LRDDLHLQPGLKKAFEALDKKTEVMEHCIEITGIEMKPTPGPPAWSASCSKKKGLHRSHQGQGDLYEFWKTHTDRCEDVADGTAKRKSQEQLAPAMSTLAWLS